MPAKNEGPREMDAGTSEAVRSLGDEPSEDSTETGPTQANLLTEAMRFWAPIVPRLDGLFEFADDGDLMDTKRSDMAVILPVEDFDGVIIDLVSWLWRDPSQWWLRRGDAIVLGEHALKRAEWCGYPVVLYETPSDWLDSRDIAAVSILNWSCDPRWVLRHAGKVICTSGRLEERLRRRILECSEPTFEITVKAA